MTTEQLTNRHGLADIVDAPIRRRHPLVNTPAITHEGVPEFPIFVRIRDIRPNTPVNAADGFAEFPELTVERIRRRRPIPNIRESIRELFSNVVHRLLYPPRR